MKYNVEKDSKKFYFGKQEDYSKYRPTYPIELFDFLSKEYNMKNIWRVGFPTLHFIQLSD